MSRFEDLQKAYFDHEERIETYERECYALGQTLLVGYRHFLDAPEEAFHYFPPSEGFDPNSGSRYTPVGAMELEDDAFWHMGLAVDFAPENHVIPQVVFYKFLLKKINDNVILKNGEKGDEFTLDADDFQTEAVDFYKSVFKETESVLQESFDNFLHQKDTDSEIGFNF